MLFDYEFSTVPFIRKDTIPPNWTDIVKFRSQSGATENINLRDNWFTPDLEEHPSKTSSNEPSVAPNNNDKTLTLTQSIQHLQGIPAIEGVSVSEVKKRPDY